MSTDTPVYAGKPLAFDLAPVELSKKRYAEIKNQLEALLVRLEAFTTEALNDPNTLKKLGLPADLPQDPTPLGLHIPFARFDIVLDEKQMWIYELNTDGTSGYNVCEWLQEKAEIKDEQNPNLNLSERLLKGLLAHDPKTHDIHLMDFRDVETSWEQKDLVRRWQKLGVEAKLSDPRVRSWLDGSLMYRRALSWQLRTHSQECRLFLDDWAQKKIKVVGGWSSDVGMSKAWPALLNTELVPKTVLVSAKNLPEFESQKDNWVLKGALSYSGRSVFRGKDLNPQRWSVALKTALSESENGRPWVAQEFRSPPQFEGKNLELGIFCINGKVSGVMARWGSQAAISETSSEVLRPVKLI